MESQIKFTVKLDEERIPEFIGWEASDSGMEGQKPAESIMLTVWDTKENTTLRIDLWTKKMLVDDMKRFFFESFATMADTYQRATNDEEGSKMIREFSEDFRKKTEAKTKGGK
jgi:gliding motility-associated protein GldC